MDAWLFNKVDHLAVRATCSCADLHANTQQQQHSDWQDTLAVGCRVFGLGLWTLKGSFCCLSWEFDRWVRRWPAQSRVSFEHPPESARWGPGFGPYLTSALALASGAAS